MTTACLNFCYFVGFFFIWFVECYHLFYFPFSLQTLFSHFGVDTDDFPPEPPAPSAIPVGHVDMDHSPTRTLLNSSSIHRTDISDSKYEIKKEAIDIKFETLRSYDQDSLLEMDSHNSRMSGADLSRDSHDDQDQSMHSMLVTPELMGMVPGVSTRSGRF